MRLRSSSTRPRSDNTSRPSSALATSIDQARLSTVSPNIIFSATKIPGPAPAPVVVEGMVFTPGRMVGPPESLATPRNGTIAEDVNMDQVEGTAKTGDGVGHIGTAGHELLRETKAGGHGSAGDHQSHTEIRKYIQRGQEGGHREVSDTSMRSELSGQTVQQVKKHVCGPSGESESIGKGKCSVESGIIEIVDKDTCR